MAEGRSETIATHPFHPSSFTVDRYLMFYRPVKDSIQVMRIVSGYRDLGEIFPELGDT